MRRVVRFTAQEIRPDPVAVCRRQGVPLGMSVSPRLRALIDTAAKTFDELATPIALFDDLSRDEFAAVFRGAGLNERDTPMAHILPRAESQALFAATIGPEVEAEVRRWLRVHDAALACTLDALASAASERLADLVARQYLASIDPQQRDGSPIEVLPYSPGYCGWHVTGQQALFERLQPREIGIALNGRCVMNPTKSVSGVLIAGPGSTHIFRPAYLFCDTCRTRECRDRMRALREAQ